MRTIVVNGRTLVDFADAGATAGLHYFHDPSGLACVGRKPDFDYTSHELNLRDDTITAFDMPEKLASPKDGARIPVAAALIRARALNRRSSRARRMISTASMSSCSGGTVPAPGVYPRLLFSPQDIPALQDRLEK